jgi:hypothetical protein
MDIISCRLSICTLCGCAGYKVILYCVGRAERLSATRQKMTWLNKFSRGTLPGEQSGTAKAYDGTAGGRLSTVGQHSMLRLVRLCSSAAQRKPADILLGSRSLGDLRLLKREQRFFEPARVRADAGSFREDWPSWKLSGTTQGRPPESDHRQPSSKPDARQNTVFSQLKLGLGAQELGLRCAGCRIRGSLRPVIILMSLCELHYSPHHVLQLGSGRQEGVMAA